MNNELSHYGVLGMKWGVRKTNKLKSFELTEKKVDLNGTPAKQYTWSDRDGETVAEFKTFNWWDGKNLCDLEVSTKYRKQGLSYELLDYATMKLGCKNLAVEKNNSIAKHVYDKYGFEVTEEDGDRYYMSLKEKDLNDELSHYGVLGMKWGVRRSGSVSKIGSSRSKVKRYDELKKLSDSELRAKINRMQMEKQYKQLKSRDLSTGEKIAKEILIGGAKVAATAYVTKYVGENIASVLDPILRKK